MGASGEVEKTESAVPESDGGISIGTLRVRSAVGEGTGHGRQGLFGGVRLVAQCRESGDAAHGSRFEDKARGFKRGAWGGIKIKIKIKFKMSWRMIR